MLHATAASCLLLYGQKAGKRKLLQGAQKARERDHAEEGRKRQEGGCCSRCGIPIYPSGPCMLFPSEREEKKHACLVFFSRTNCSTAWASELRACTFLAREAVEIPVVLRRRDISRCFSTARQHCHRRTGLQKGELSCGAAPLAVNEAVYLFLKNYSGKSA